MDEPRWPYLLFLAAVPVAAALALILPVLLGVTQARGEELVMFGFLPVTAWVVWALRKREIQNGTVTQDGNGTVDH